jgi:hypothetical protein
MGGPKAKGSEIDQRTIQEIINAGGRGISGSAGLSVPSVGAGIAGAVAALIAYGQTHGPGIGIVTVTDASGTHVVAIGPVGGSFSYNGTTYVGGIPVRGLNSPLISTGGGGWWSGILGGWADFPGPQAGEGFHPSGEP